MVSILFAVRLSRLTAPQASSTASTTTPLRHAFERRVEDVKPMKRYGAAPKRFLCWKRVPLSSYKLPPTSK